MKHFFKICSALILASIIVISLPSLAYAQINHNDVEVIDGTIIISVNSDEEYNQIVDDINNKNKLSEELWQRALEGSASDQKAFYVPETAPMAFKVLSVDHNDWITSFYIAAITFSATINTSFDANGVERIGQIHLIDAYGRTSRTTVSVQYKAHRLSDAARTLSVNYSCRVGIRNPDSGSISYFSRAYYVEFYASGGAHVY